MAVPLLLTEIIWPVAKKILFNRYVLIGIAAAVLCAGAYFKGVSVERHKWEVRIDAQIAQAVSEALKETQEAMKVQEKLEVAHDKRIQKILSHNIPDDGIARMLSTWPDRESGETATPGTP